MTSAADAIDWSRAPEGLDRIAAELRAMRRTAGDPSYAAIGRAVARLRAARGLPEHEQRMPRSTLYDCFREGRRRLDPDAVGEIALTLGLPRSQHARWMERVRAAQAAADGAAIAVALDGAPPPVPYFAGHAAELARIRQALDAADARVWITGMPGSGKTQLALTAAERLAACGSVFLDLRGRHAESPPVEAAAARRAILRQLTADPADDAAATSRLSQLLRESGRLIVLDDAADAAHVTAVLGDTPPGRLVVTSRAAAPTAAGWTEIALAGMDAAGVAALLANLAADTRIEPASARRLAAACDGLPLAIALVGGRLASHPEWTLEEHIDLLEERLANAHLDEELGGTLSLAYGDLPADAQRLLRAFADLPIPELGPEVAAVAAGLDSGDSADPARLLGVLADSGLAIRRPAGRIALHSLVRAHARARARDTDPPRLRTATFGRIARYAAERVWSAYHALMRSQDDVTRRTRFAYPVGEWGAEEARRWLEANRPALLALAHAAPERGHPDLLFRLSEGLSWWMNVAGHHDEALRLHEAAADVAADRGDADALAMASLDAGQLLTYRNRLDASLAHLQRATRLVDRPGDLADPGLAGVVLNMTALVHLRQGRVTEAEDALRWAVALHEELGEHTRTMGALTNLGIALFTAGRFAEVDAVLARGLALATERGNDLHVTNLLINRAYLRLTTGDLDAALADAADGIARAEALDSLALQISGHGTVAEALRRRGELAAAQERIDAVLVDCRRLGSGMTTAEQLLTAAALAGDGGEPERARTILDEAESLLTEGGDAELRGRIWCLRGDLTGPPERERWHERALEQFEAAGSFRARDLRAVLTAG